MNVIDSIWALKFKRFPDRMIKKFKARFCARGCMHPSILPWRTLLLWTRSLVDVGVVEGGVGRVALLPQELLVAEERCGVLELRAVAPLVGLEGEVVVAPHLVGEGQV